MKIEKTKLNWFKNYVKPARSSLFLLLVQLSECCVTNLMCNIDNSHRRYHTSKPTFEEKQQMKRHDLNTDFPEFKERIHELKMTDGHFKRLFDEYDELDKDVHRIESGAEQTTDEVLNNLRAKRVVLKDELYERISKTT